MIVPKQTKQNEAFLTLTISSSLNPVLSLLSTIETLKKREMKVLVLSFILTPGTFIKNSLILIHNINIAQQAQVKVPRSKERENPGNEVFNARAPLNLKHAMNTRGKKGAFGRLSPRVPTYTLVATRVLKLCLDCHPMQQPSSGLVFHSCNRAWS